MPSLTDFYTKTDWEVKDHSLSCVLAFNEAHPIFTGHFPGNPIVPGVTTIEILMALLEEALGLRLALQNAQNIKFLQLITPVSRPAVNMSWTESAGIYAATAIMKDGAATLFKMSASYATKQ